MTPTEIVRATLAAIAATDLDYVLVGAFATGYYAFPRATKDADFVVAAPLGAISDIAPHFPPAFHVDPQPQMEMLTGTFRWIVRVDGTEFRVEIFHLGSDPHHEAIFSRHVAVETPEFGGKVWIPTAEDLVIQKLRWGRPKAWRTCETYCLSRATRWTISTSKSGARSTELSTASRKCERVSRRTFDLPQAPQPTVLECD